MRTWRVRVLRHALLSEFPDGFSSGTGHQRLCIYTVVYAVTQSRRDSLWAKSPHPLGTGR